MEKLYGKQQQVADEISKALVQESHMLNHKAYISGEMGVGKTYIASNVIKQIADPKVLTLIISPSEVTRKWQSVLTSFGVNNIQIFNRKTEIIQNGILIIVDRELTPAMEQLSNRKIDFIVYDEIHKIKPESKVFENLTTIQKQYASKRNMFLGLTGTIFGQNIENLMKILKYTHPKVFTSSSSLNFHLPTFMSKWTQIAWIISLSDVESHFQSDGQDDLEQTIAPIKLIQPTPEQKLVYELAREQLLGAKVNQFEQEAILLLDYPRRNQAKYRNLRIGKQYGPNPHSLKKYSLTFALKDIDFTHTPKYQKLIDILQNPEKTLVFVNDEDLIEKLSTTLSDAGFKVGTLPNSIKSHSYSQFINDALSSDIDIFVLNPMRISVGVDINTASRIVWYQLLSDLSSTIQAQRRVYRLSSTKSSIIHYLAYADTYQEELITEISESSKRNAAAYGTNDTSNLAKLSGVLFNTEL